MACHNQLDLVISAAVSRMTGITNAGWPSYWPELNAQVIGLLEAEACYLCPTPTHTSLYLHSDCFQLDCLFNIPARFCIVNWCIRLVESVEVTRITKAITFNLKLKENLNDKLQLELS